MYVEHVFQVCRLHVMKPRQPPQYRRGTVVISGQIQFGAVAGRQDRRLAGAGSGTQFGKRLGHTLGRERDALTQLYRCGAMIDSEGDQCHIGVRLPYL